MANVVYANRGADVRFSFVWPSSLSASSIAVFEPAEVLDGNITLTVDNAALGEVSGVVEWADTYPTAQSLGFRIRVTTGTLDEALPEVRLYFQ